MLGARSKSFSVNFGPFLIADIFLIAENRDVLFLSWNLCLNFQYNDNTICNISRLNSALHCTELVLLNSLKAKRVF